MPKIAQEPLKAGNITQGGGEDLPPAPASIIWGPDWQRDQFV